MALTPLTDSTPYFGVQTSALSLPGSDRQNQVVGQRKRFQPTFFIPGFGGFIGLSFDSFAIEFGTTAFAAQRKSATLTNNSQFLGNRAQEGDIVSTTLALASEYIDFRVLMPITTTWRATWSLGFRSYRPYIDYSCMFVRTQDNMDLQARALHKWIGQLGVSSEWFLTLQTGLRLFVHWQHTSDLRATSLDEEFHDFTTQHKFQLFKNGMSGGFAIFSFF